MFFYLVSPDFSGQVLHDLPWLAMSCCDHIFVSDKYTSALVFGEQTEPGRLTNQHLPWPFPKLRALPADDFSRSWD